MTIPGRAAAKATLGLSVAVAILLAIETGLALSKSWWMPPPDETTVLRNANDPTERVVDLGANADTSLGEMVLFNIRSNELTRPDPQFLFRVRPNPSGDAVHGYTGINEQGFRGRLLDPVEAKAHPSVLLLGDSCGFGWGIREYSLTFAAILEKQLGETDPGVRLYNLSQPGYSTAQARALYEDRVSDVEPEIVIVYLGWNDLWPAGRLDDAEAIARTRQLDTPILRAVRGTHLYRFIESQIGRVDDHPAAPSGETGESPGLRRVSASDSLHNLRAIVDDARDRGARVIVIPPPYVEEWIGLPGIDRIGEFNAALYAEFKDDVEFAELAAMRSVGPSRLFMRDGYHPSPLGSQILARELADQIRRGSAQSRR